MVMMKWKKSTSLQRTGSKFILGRLWEVFSQFPDNQSWLDLQALIPFEPSAPLKHYYGEASVKGLLQCFF